MVDGAASAGGPAHEAGLLDDYQLGDVLGQGAFGVVHLCTQKGALAGSEEYAVKMVDKVETPLEAIKTECELLKKHAHPTLVALHRVYYEQVFVCMVMDLHRGGDLIDAMSAHWEAHGPIPCSVVPGVAAQMLKPLAWLHSRNCAHLDIKGDNYLANVGDILSPDFRLWLSDFGTATEFVPGVPMKEACGTKIYWAPEQFGKKYGPKVDVWAVGVVVFGLIKGTFPFSKPTEITWKEVKLPARAPRSGKEFLGELLSRSVADRPEAVEALLHPWLSTDLARTSTSLAEDHSALDEELNEEGFGRTGQGNAGQRERRRLLVERLEQVKQAKDSAAEGPAASLPLATFWRNSFVVSRRGSTKVKYEWQTPLQLQRMGNTVLHKMNLDAEKAFSTPRGSTDVIGAMLREHGIDTESFRKGDSQSLEQFADDLHQGVFRLMIAADQHKTMVRVVDLVLIRIVWGEGPAARYLVKSSESFDDGRARTDINQLPGTKKLPHESTLQVAQRLLSHRLHLDGVDVCLDFTRPEVFEEESCSASYPAVRTVYRKEIIQGRLRASGRELDLVGLDETCRMTTEELAPGAPRCVRVYSWMTEAECQTLKIRLGAPTFAFSTLVQAPAGYEEEKLVELLLQHGVNVSRYGRGHSKSLRDLSDELSRGEAHIEQDEKGHLRRIVDVVMLKVVRPFSTLEEERQRRTTDDGCLLVEAEEIYEDGSSKALCWLPAVKRRPEESHFLAARRVLERLRIDPNQVELDPTDVRIVEEEKDSFFFPGLKTLYRKRIVTAKIMRIKEFLLLSDRHQITHRSPGSSFSARLADVWTCCASRGGE